MAGDADGKVVVPTTLQALLAARLDQLETAERSVLERGAVEGEIFHRGAVQALAPDETQVTPRLAALVRKELIRPDRPLLAGEDGFRFRHILIRDAAYNALPKATRAQLHERFASWLEQHGAELVELDEILGYHFEQACQYRAELGLEDDAALAAAARQRLAAGGLRAARYQDYRATVSLLERAAALVPAGALDLALEVELGDALIWVGKASKAIQRADAFTERAAARGDRLAELCGKIRGCDLRLSLGEGTPEKLAALVEHALPVFRDAGDDLALFVAHLAHSDIDGARGMLDSALEAYEQALSHAQRAGYQPTGSLGTRAALRFFGTTAASDMLAWLDENEPQAGRDYFLRAFRAGALAMLGRFDDARTILAEDRAALEERGGGQLLANITAFESAWVELWAGDPAAAAQFGAEGWRLHVELGESFALALAAATFSRALYELDRLDEAEAWADRAAELGASDDALSAMPWRQVKAKVLARQGETVEAERLARKAVAIGEDTDRLNEQGDTYADLAEVLLLAGKTGEAVAALEQALERYERKGNRVSTQRAQTRLAELQDAAPR